MDIWIYGKPYTDGTGRVAYEVQCVRCHATGPFQLYVDVAANS